MLSPPVKAILLGAVWVLGDWSPWQVPGSRTAWFEAAAWGASHGLRDLATSSKAVTVAVASCAVVGAMLRLSTASQERSYLWRQTGRFLTCLPLSLVMPAWGAVLFLGVAFIFFLVGCIGPETPFKDRKLTFVQRLLGESFSVLVAVCVLALSWQYNAQLLTRGLLVATGLALLAQAALPAAGSREGLDSGRPGAWGKT